MAMEEHWLGLLIVVRLLGLVCRLWGRSVAGSSHTGGFRWGTQG